MRKIDAGVFFSSWAANRFRGGVIGTKIFGILGAIILFPSRYVSETDKSDNTRFQKNFGLDVSMVSNHVTPLWPILKTSTLPKVFPSKVNNLKMWYLAEILCVIGQVLLFWQNRRTCPIWILKFHLCDVTTDDVTADNVTKWSFCSCLVLIQKNVYSKTIT